jgi:hypothetical protein
MAKQEGVNWDDFVLKEGAKPGDKQKAEVTEVYKTTWRKHLKEKGREGALEAFENKDGPQLAVSVKTADGREFTELMSLPDGKEVSSISNLGKYRELYKKFPEVGDRIEVQADKKGFWNIFVI